MKGDGNWCRAYALGLHGKPVTFLGAYAAVTVVRNDDDSFTADITRPSGETDIRAYARRGEGAGGPLRCTSRKNVRPGPPSRKGGRSQRARPGQGARRPQATGLVLIRDAL